MLVRFIIKNLFSFQEFTEFNMLPGRFGRFPDHIKEMGGAELLKLNVLYGANGAGKSNLIQALSVLKSFVVTGEMPTELINDTFKFDKEGSHKDIYLGVEFIKEDTPYYYGVTINQGIIVDEELQISGLGNRPDVLLFHRTDAVGEKKISLEFSTTVEADKEASIFPAFLKNEILKRNAPVMHYMESRQNKVFETFKAAYDWFASGLTLIVPSSKPADLHLTLEKDRYFYEFARHIMQSFKTGVQDITVETIPLEEFLGKRQKEEAERITAEVRADPDRITILEGHLEYFPITIENNQVVVKKLIFTHVEDGGEQKFTPAQESDGTRRLLDYLPAFYAVVNTSKTFVIDEIERSIHPVLIKELIKKFSHDPNTKGQLIFSTHESNLLDQDIFRPDEIWFIEKNKQGASELYALSEFKEHHTKDIRKGYLNGRYGAIPFTGNLRDLNWRIHAQAD